MKRLKLFCYKGFVHYKAEIAGFPIVFKVWHQVRYA